MNFYNCVRDVGTTLTDIRFSDFVIRIAIYQFPNHGTTMLREIKLIRQIRGEPKRRWFTDNFFDLIIWENDDGRITGFQLSYDKGHNEHALSWSNESGFTHNRIDDGEGTPGKIKSSPVLIPDGTFHRNAIADRFKKASRRMDTAIADVILDAIIHAPSE